LVPKKFEEIEVINIEYFNSKRPWYHSCKGLDIPLFALLAPENYIRFVDENEKLIKTKLNNNNLSKQEILDTLKGGFDEHKQKVQKLKEEFFKKSTESN